MSYVPTIEENDNGDSMSFFDRAYNLYMYFGAIYIHRKATDMTTEVSATRFTEIRLVEQIIPSLKKQLNWTEPNPQAKQHAVPENHQIVPLT